MSAEPQTTITIYKAVTDMTYTNVYDYGSEGAFLSALNTNTHVVFYDQQYVRKNFAIELEIPFDEAEDYTYCVYDNGEGRGNEFAFIKEKIFCNFSVTRFVLVYDVWANYQKLSGYYTSGLRGFVERCHQDYNHFNMLPDTIMNANLSKWMNDNVTPCYMALVVFDADNANISNTNAGFTTNNYERIGSYLHFFSANKASLNGGKESLYLFAKEMTSSPYVYAVYLTKVPIAVYNAITSGNFVLSNITISGEGDAGYFGTKTNSSYNHISANFTVSVQYQSNDDMNCNKFPYYYYTLYVPGGNILLSLDNFDEKQLNTNIFTLTINMNLTFSSTGITIKYSPSYNDIRDNDSSILVTMIDKPLTKNVDNFDAFVSQNSSYLNQVIWSALSSGLQTGVNAGIHGKGIAESAVLAGASTVMNLIDNVANLQFKINDLNRAPDKPSFGYNVVYDENLFSGGCIKFVKHYLDDDSLNMIHNKFVSMGYPLNKYVDINYRIRTNYDFIKGYDITTVHRVCNEERAILNQIFSRGVRIWHNPLPMEFGVPSTNANNPMRS